MALTFTPTSELGSNLPNFELPATDGKKYGSSYFKKGKPALVMFICNHCPYVQAVEDRLIELGHKLKVLDVGLLAICSNDPIDYPEDNFTAMKERASKKRYSFPYLQDESQEVAKSFGALCTPDFFLYDSEHKLQYRGRLDNSWKDSSKVTAEELLMAATALRQNKKIDFKVYPSMGCSIKWRTK